jgi:capsular polysaccharide export protein
MVSRLVSDRRRFFLFPLQLQNDYQLRCNAGFKHQSDAIRTVVQSFADNAAKDAWLVIKCHPLDNGGERWPEHIGRVAKAANVSERILYIDGGKLPLLLDHACGTVTINSTVGMHALIAGCPVKVLGTALFDIEGLTHRSTLDSFWTSPSKPDPALVDALVRALAGTTQVRGDFFTKEGRHSAIATFVERLTTGTVNGAGAFVTPPPRLGACRHLDPRSD